MNNSFYPTLSSQLCNFGNNNDVQILNSDVSVKIDRGGAYGSNYYNFFRESQVTNDQYLGSFAPLSTVDIPSASFNNLNLPGLFSATCSLTEGSSTSSIPMYNNISKPQFPHKGFSLQNTQINERKQTIKMEDRTTMMSKNSALEESRKRKAAIAIEDKRPRKCPHFHEQQRRHSFVTHVQKAPVKRSQRIGDKVAILQKLVNPYGKTDTASVLSETASYIKLVHEQIKNLSNPYFRAPQPRQLQLPQGAGARKDDLRSKELCLVPISFTKNIIKEDEVEDHYSTITRLIFKK